MDSHEASKNMLAVIDFIAGSAKVAHGEGAVATARLIGFKKGSFEPIKRVKRCHWIVLQRAIVFFRRGPFIWLLPGLTFSLTAC